MALKKVLSCFLALILCFLLLACELPSSNVSFGSGKGSENVPLETAAPLTDAAPAVSAVPAATAIPEPTSKPLPVVKDDKYLSILVSDAWVDTDDQTTTLNFLENGTGTGSCKDEGELYTDVKYDILWNFTDDNGSISVAYYYYVGHTTEFRLDLSGEKPVLESIKGGRTYLRDSDF